MSVFLLLLTVGCSRERSLQAELNMKVEAANRPGVYIVSGKTNLPDQSRIIVQGIRPLTSSAQPASPGEPSNYAILDRQAVVVSQGQWQATLKLWQSTTDGQYQEVWQTNQAQMRRLKPDADVVFVAAIDSASQPKALAQPLDNQGKQLQGANIRFATDGQWYLQTKQTLTVTPPIVKTASLVLNVNDLNEGLSLRSELNNVPINATSANLPVLKDKQTTAPLSFAQHLR
ncbi:hypothetical protein C7B82_18260 [Stenomitos frigidus ULC18]|uniref:Uncharacterized protein n=2 Tax=Stenomitos TaxID=1844270 RepID=A0A2T1E239_9CYAN|nr:hypothetical protein C7B82_18260 [Stenomitos frigidus ULC18]